MKTRRTPLLVGAAALLLLGGWALFRPELLLIDRRVDERFPGPDDRAAGTSPLARGAFRGIAHETTGDAEIHRLADGSRILRLSRFATSNGPDLRVLLVALDEAGDSESVRGADRIELGRLKGNIGDQNYPLDTAVDLRHHRAVVIWCHRFGVNFASAALEAPGADASGTDASAADAGGSA